MCVCLLSYASSYQCIDDNPMLRKAPYGVIISIITHSNLRDAVTNDGRQRDECLLLIPCVVCTTLSSALFASHGNTALVR